MAKKTKKKPAKKAARPKGAAGRTKKTAKKTTKKAVKKTIKKSAGKKSAKKSKASKPKAKAKKASPKKAATPVMKPSLGINPYLTFAGNCEEAFKFYQSVFGGKFPYVGRFKEMPPMDGKPVPAEEGDKIMHISLPIGSGTLMGSDSSEAFGHASVIGNNFSISINATSRQEADRIFNGISAGGKVTMPMSDTFWGSYFGMCVDKFGIQWMMSYDKAPQTK
jgi:PhnB protein